MNETKNGPTPEGKVSRSRGGPQPVEVGRQKEIRRESQVCHIRRSNDKTGSRCYGTGFLVGPDSILTNWHVYQMFKKCKEEVEVVFDFKRGVDGYSIRNPIISELHASPLLASSKYGRDEFEGQKNCEEPGLNELDYAVLRLDREMGCCSGRGWNCIPEVEPPNWRGEIVKILQHPSGEILCCAEGKILCQNKKGSRVFYDVDTEAGSSGAPCYDLDWELLALHQGEQSDFSNRGIPIHLISKDLVRQGKWELLRSEEKQPKSKRSICHERGRQEQLSAVFFWLILSTIIAAFLMLAGYGLNSLRKTEAVTEPSSMGQKLAQELPWEIARNSAVSVRELTGANPLVEAKQVLALRHGLSSPEQVDAALQAEVAWQKTNRKNEWRFYLAMEDFENRDFSAAAKSARKAADFFEAQERKLAVELGEVAASRNSLIKKRERNHVWLRASMLLEAGALTAHFKHAKAVKVYRELLDLIDKKTEPKRWITIAFALANSSMECKDYLRSLELHEEVLRISEREFGKEIFPTISVRHNLTKNLIHLGKYSVAEKGLGETLKQLERQYGLHAPVTLRAKTVRGAIYYGRKEYSKAKDFYEKHQVNLETATEENSPSVLLCKEALGVVLVALGSSNFERAYQILKEVEKERLSKLGPNNPETLGVQFFLGWYYSSIRNFEAAEQILRSVVIGRGLLFGEDHVDFQLARCELGRVYLAWGKMAEAEKLVPDAFKVIRKVLGSDHQFSLTAEEASAALDIKRGDFGQGISKFERLLKVETDRNGVNQVALKLMVNLGGGYVNDQQYEKGRVVLREVISVSRDRKDIGRYGEVYLHALNNLATCYEEKPQPDYRLARELYEEALAGFVESRGTSSWEAERVRLGLLSLEEKEKKE